jgi:hypothetical protein
LSVIERRFARQPIFESEIVRAVEYIMTENNARLFREAFLRILAEKIPAWKAYLAESDADDRVEVWPSNWKGLPFRISISSDTVSVFPLCDFALDYISTANTDDLKERPDLVFAKVVSDIADFVGGRTVVAIKRRKFLFMKAGWDVRFLPHSAVDAARRTGASIISWQT